eukprot:TRINITY_DN10179_c0_g1_i3.p1 TRINITY_DN10179_c0_g1~~TRINITY_DN10179_c0_g1_i3.p1  ORF type:complete len:443 (+),score=140.56 TRINITY_DN10179_c0_g1_i3:65-1393(+)
MAVFSGTDRKEELALLTAEHKELKWLLLRISSSLHRAAQLAESVRTRLGRVEAMSPIDPALEAVLSTAVQLRLDLIMEPSGARVPVDLPFDATVSRLQAAAHDAGGPPPLLQQLEIGGARLVHAGRKLLSGTGLVRPGASVVVQRRDLRRKRVSAGFGHAAALLDNGQVLCWGHKSAALPSPAFSRGSVTSVHAGFGFTAAVVAGGIELWGEDSARYQPGVQSIRGDVVCCSAALPRSSGVAAYTSLGAVLADGRLLLWDSSGAAVAAPADVDGTVSALSIGPEDTVVLVTYGGGVRCLRKGPCGGLRAEEAPDLGGGYALSASAGTSHYAVLLDDGSVRCFGSNDKGQCDCPCLRDAVACECGANYTVALRADGSLCWWGDVPPHGRITAAGRCAAVAVGVLCTVAVTADGWLVADGGSFSKFCGVHPIPASVRRRQVATL